MVPESLNDFLGVEDGDCDEYFVLSPESEDKDSYEIELGKYIWLNEKYVLVFIIVGINLLEKNYFNFKLCSISVSI